MEGGVMPVGSECSTACEAAANCATAASTLALGWKKILMMDKPGSDCDSMCSMSLTDVVKERSQRMVTTSAAGAVIPIENTLAVLAEILEERVVSSRSLMGRVIWPLRWIFTIR